MGGGGGGGEGGGRGRIEEGYLSLRHKQTGLRDFRGGVGIRLA